MTNQPKPLSERIAEFKFAAPWADEVAALEAQLAEANDELQERRETDATLGEFRKLGAVEKYFVMAHYPWHFAEALEADKEAAFIDLHKYATVLERENAAMQKTNEEQEITLDAVADLCGEALGTAHEYRSPIGCASALANYVKQLRDENAAIRERNKKLEWAISLAIRDLDDNDSRALSVAAVNALLNVRKAAGG